MYQPLHVTVETAESMERIDWVATFTVPSCSRRAAAAAAVCRPRIR